MKKCSECNINKPSSNFYTKNDKCKDCTTEYNRNWYKNSSEEFKKRHRARTARWAKNNKDKVSVYNKRYNLKLKIEVLSHYTDDNIRCQCPSDQCTETHLEFMSIDHINGGGHKHRKELAGIGTLLYIWLKKKNYPSGYRVLCMNCNFSLGRSGYCPHSL